ncbi:MAG TPA: hypothetical protein DIW47_05035 [Bacteroidetes bacterium]|nr:hypothetical protein [Bacteroidota bacterium]
MNLRFSTLKEVIGNGLISDDFVFLNGDQSSLLTKIFVKEFVPLSGAPDSLFNFNGKLVYNESVQFGLFGLSDFILKIEPSASVPAYTEVSINTNVSIPILSYIRDFKLSSFDWSLESIFNLFLNCFGLERNDILERVIFRINADATSTNHPVSDFVNLFNSMYGSSTGTITYNNNDDDSVVVSDLISQIGSLNLDIIDVVYNSFIKNLDLEVFKLNIQSLFYEEIGNLNFEKDLSKLLLPHVVFSLNADWTGYEPPVPDLKTIFQ